ncbi:hypothetical protein KAH94_04595 [bacterium]|nr:hypothetical protein [bacterium]
MKNQPESNFNIIECIACGHHFDGNKSDWCPTCHGTGRKKELSIDYFTAVSK